MRATSSSRAPIPGQKDKGDASLFDGIDTSAARPRAVRAGASAPAALTAGLAAIADAVTARGAARSASGGPAAAVAPLVEGLQAVRALRAQLASRAIAIPTMRATRSTSAWRTKERQFSDAVLAAGGVRLEALADDGLVVAGQPVKVTVIVANRGASPIAVKQIGFRGLDGEAGVCKTGTVAAAAVLRCEAPLEISKQARLTGQYWKRLPDAGALQFEPDAPFGAAVPADAVPRAVRRSTIGGAAIARRARRAVPLRRQHLQRREADGADTSCRALAVSLTPEIAIVPASQRCRRRRAPPGASCGSP